MTDWWGSSKSTVGSSYSIATRSVPEIQFWGNFFFFLLLKCYYLRKTAYCRENIRQKKNRRTNVSVEPNHCEETKTSSPNYIFSNLSLILLLILTFHFTSYNFMENFEVGPHVLACGCMWKRLPTIQPNKNAFGERQWCCFVLHRRWPFYHRRKRKQNQKIHFWFNVSFLFMHECLFFLFFSVGLCLWMRELSGREGAKEGRVRSYYGHLAHAHVETFSRMLILVKSSTQSLAVNKIEQSKKNATNQISFSLRFYNMIAPHAHTLWPRKTLLGDFFVFFAVRCTVQLFWWQLCLGNKFCGCHQTCQSALHKLNGIFAFFFSVCLFVLLILEKCIRNVFVRVPIEK